MFSQVSVCPHGGGMCGGGACMCGRGSCVTEECAWQGVCHKGHTWQGACMVGGYAWQGGARDRRDGHCSGRYASYWNAFLLRNICTEITIFYTCHVKYISSASVNPMLLTIPITVQWGSQFCPLRWDSAVQHV